MYYENFEKLCIEHNVKPATVSKETGISTATLSNWKNGNYTPKQDKLKLIADYFNVSIECVMTGKEKEYTKEMAGIDAKLIFMSKEVKEYALKLNNLPKEKQKTIIDLIDQLS